MYNVGRPLIRDVLFGFLWEAPVTSWAAQLLQYVYTEAKMDVTQEIEQDVQWCAPAWAACCALCSISCVTSTLASV